MSIRLLTVAGAVVVAAALTAGAQARSAAANGSACCWRFVFVVDGVLTAQYQRGVGDGSSVQIWREGKYDLWWRFQRRGISRARWADGHAPSGLEPLSRETLDATEVVLQETSKVDSVVQSGSQIRRTPVRCRRNGDDDFVVNTDVMGESPVSYTVQNLDAFTRLGRGPQCDELGQAWDFHLFSGNRQMFDWKLGAGLLPVPAMVRSNSGFRRFCTFKVEGANQQAGVEFRGYMTAYVRFTHFPRSELPKWTKALRGYVGRGTFPGHDPVGMPQDPFGPTDEPFRASDPANGCHKL